MFLHLLPEVAEGNEAIGEALSDVIDPAPLFDLGIFLVALAGFTALITYTMPLRVRTGVLFALLFTVAMGLHFVLTDRGLEERYGPQFSRRGRIWLAAALVAGWAAAALLAPTSALLVALLTALLAGSILLNVFKEEIPSGLRTSFPWLLAGLTVYAGLLTLVTALSE